MSTPMPADDVEQRLIPVLGQQIRVRVHWGAGVPPAPVIESFRAGLNRRTGHGNRWAATTSR
ncbi:hypothetical protein [Nocardia sp. NPDC004123]